MIVVCITVTCHFEAFVIVVVKVVIVVSVVNVVCVVNVGGNNGFWCGNVVVNGLWCGNVVVIVIIVIVSVVVDDVWEGWMDGGVVE